MQNSSKKINIFNLGVSHKSSDVDFRESLYISQEFLENLLAKSKKAYALEELVIISTCNRFEMFGISSNNHELNNERLYELFLSIQSEKSIDLDTLKSSSYIYRDESAIHHIVCVASSLDSLIVGETQITGQFKQAVNTAKEASTLGPILDRLAQEALACSKKIRRSTAIGEKTVSISHSAIDLAKRIFGDISKQRILIIGAGEMSRLAYQYAASYKPTKLMVANRTLSNAQALVEEVGLGSFHGLDEIPYLLEDTNIVISCTNSQKHLISKNMLEAVLTKKSKSDMFLCDIAVPRDIDPRCGDFDGVFLFEVDDLKQIVDENIEERRAIGNEARIFVDQATKAFGQWLNTHDLKPVLGSLKGMFDGLLEQEMGKTLSRDMFSDLTEAQKSALASMNRSTSSKILGLIAGAIKNELSEADQQILIQAVSMIFLSPVGGKKNDTKKKQEEEKEEKEDVIGNVRDIRR